jgi:hypothetical protein
VWSKPKKYALVLCPDSMHLMVSMAVQKCCTLYQGDCKNAFCQGILPDNKLTIVKPAISDSDVKNNKYWLLKRTLYGLRQSPHHWYTKINSILNQLGLKANSSDPCLFTGHIVDPSNPELASHGLSLLVYTSTSLSTFLRTPPSKDSWKDF